MSEGVPMVPSEVQALQPGDQLFTWDEEGVTRYVVLELFHNVATEDAPAITLAVPGDLPVCEAGECPHKGQYVDCEQCPVTSIELRELVHELQYTTVSGIAAGGCYCLLKELDD